MGDEIDSQRERFSAILRQGVSAGAVTLDEYDSKLGAIYSAQGIAELESLVPWALAPRSQGDDGLPFDRSVVAPAQDRRRVLERYPSDRWSRDAPCHKGISEAIKEIA